MKLSIKDNTEIDVIISRLTEGDYEIIHAEVERLAEKLSANPIASAIADYHPDQFTDIAMEYLSETDTDFQVMVHGWLWDALTSRITREYAINVFRNKHSYDEVA